METLPLRRAETNAELAGCAHGGGLGEGRRQMYKGLRSKLLKGRGGADVDLQNAPLLQEGRIFGNGRPKVTGTPDNNSACWQDSRLQLFSLISSAKC